MIQEVHNSPETLHLVFGAEYFFSTTLEYSLENSRLFNVHSRTFTTGCDSSVAPHNLMKCIHCNNDDTRVVETRQAGHELRRRRECVLCGQRFTTYERAELPTLRIIKKDGSRELFDKEKLKRGLILSCEKRPVSADQIEHALDTIERELRRQGEAEIPSNLVGDLTMRELRRLDEVAYIRFASVYKEFRDAQSFEKEIQVLTKGN